MVVLPARAMVPSFLFDSPFLAERRDVLSYDCGGRRVVRTLLARGRG